MINRFRPAPIVAAMFWPYDRSRRRPARAVRPSPRPKAGRRSGARSGGRGAVYPQQEYLFDIIKSRRTVRDFQPAPVPKEHILKILDMARSAPTSGNQQPWKFLVVQDRAKLDRLKVEAAAWFLAEYEKRGKPAPEEMEGVRKQLAATMAKVLSAPVYVAVLTDSQSPYPPDNRNDGPLAVAL